MFSLIANLNNKSRDHLVRFSFFVFQGLLGSILLNDVLRVLLGDFNEKKLVQYGMAVLVASAPFIYSKLTILGKKENNVYMGLGMTIGAILSNVSEDKKGV
jgi:hypothetical protein